eukprot:TRINITY_DN944_c0_g1_i1.p1 TRINITY_DN944_c0_g1~~TRINITY_DN944_c0_g1_i1.p1  ORF type:complete len:1599 (-),score=476.58 TRINITY_DN944_c0_g1_i1:2-4798(-)
MSTLYRRLGGKETKPEYAIKRAEELIGLKQKVLALEVLSAYACRKRVWTKQLELLMIKLITLGVELGNKVRVKDAFHHYKNSCNNPQLLEIVLRHFITTAEQAEKQAREDALAKPDVSAENAAKLLKAVTGDDIQSAEKELAMPSIRFLWETYRTVLDVLRNDRKGLYMETCKKAFEFCRSLKTTTQFKRLCDVLRVHLQMTPKSYAESLESAPYQLEIFFDQLHTAVALELWQEAYKAVEDIKNNIFSLSLPVPNQVFADYYLQCSKLFWVSKNYFFHAEALLRYSEYVREAEDGNDIESPLVKDPKPRLVLSAEEKKDLYSRLLLAALSIPPNTKPEDEFPIQYNFQREREAMFASLLQYEGPCTRAYILEELLENDILSKVHPEVSALYHILEGKFKLFQFGKSVQQSSQWLSSNEALKQYQSSIMEIAFLKLLSQISAIYTTLSISQLTSIFPLMGYTEMERRIMDGIVSGSLECRIDHRQGVLKFQTKSLESEQYRTKLTAIAKNLKKCVEAINPNLKAELAEKKKAVYTEIAKGIAEEHKAVQQRKALIEKVKELREAAQARASRLAEEARRKEHEKQMRLENERIAQAKAQQMKTKQQMEAEEKRRKEAEALAKQIAEIAKATGKDIKIDPAVDKEEDVVKNSVKQVLKQRKKKEETLVSLASKIDHLVRAERELEVPLLKAREQELSKQEDLFWDEQREKFLQHDKQVFEEKLEVKKRLEKLTEARMIFQKQFEEKRREDYEQKKKEQDKKKEEWREKKNKEKHHVEARKQETAKREEEKKRREEEEERKRKEEERKRREEEEEERKRKEERKRREEEERAREDAKRKEEEERRKEETTDRRRRDEERSLDEKRRKSRKSSTSRGTSKTRLSRSNSELTLEEVDEPEKRTLADSKDEFRRTKRPSFRKPAPPGVPKLSLGRTTPDLDDLDQAFQELSSPTNFNQPRKNAVVNRDHERIMASLSPRGSVSLNNSVTQPRGRNTPITSRGDYNRPEMNRRTSVLKMRSPAKPVQNQGFVFELSEEDKNQLKEFFETTGVPALADFFAEQAIDLETMLAWEDPEKQLQDIGIGQQGVLFRIVRALDAYNVKNGLPSKVTPMSTRTQRQSVVRQTPPPLSPRGMVSTPSQQLPPIPIQSPSISFTIHFNTAHLMPLQKSTPSPSGIVAGMELYVKCDARSYNRRICNYRTASCNDSARPNWSGDVAYNPTIPTGMSLCFEIWDSSSFMGDRKVAECIWDWTKIQTLHNGQHWLPLKSQSDCVGELLITVSDYPEEDLEYVWQPDILGEDFEFLPLRLQPGAYGPLSATLVRLCSSEQFQTGVLYLHSFSDYFFNAELADRFNEENIAFYALDIRRYGRSLIPNIPPNWTTTLYEYFEEIHIAIDYMRRLENIQNIILLGHGLGGLIAALFAEIHNQEINALILNSPLITFNKHWTDFINKKKGWFGSKGDPLSKHPTFSTLYHQSLHVNHYGPWNWDERLKPMTGFPIFLGWVDLLAEMQRRVEAGLNLVVPTVMLVAAQGTVVGNWAEELRSADAMMNVNKVISLAPKISALVKLIVVKDAVHDIFLSGEKAREEAYGMVFDWLDTLDFNTAT